MDEVLTPACSESTLTQRYQTTVPAPVRKALGLNKSDRIRYTIEGENRVVISRVVEENESDPVLSNFLKFLESYMANNPDQIKTISTDLVKEAQSLVSDVEIDLDAPLPDEEE